MATKAWPVAWARRWREVRLSGCEVDRLTGQQHPSGFLGPAVAGVRVEVLGRRAVMLGHEFAQGFQHGRSGGENVRDMVASLDGEILLTALFLSLPMAAYSLGMLAAWLVKLAKGNDA